MKIKIKYQVYYPSGNTTALVEDILPLKLKKIVNDFIQRSDTSIEQVGFINRNQKRLEMAGGEFCGNATRSFASLLLRNQPRSVEITTSGLPYPVKAFQDKQKNVWAEIDLIKNGGQVFNQKGYQGYRFPGITQIVINLDTPPSSPEQYKQQGLEILQKLNLTETEPASGIMSIVRNNSTICLYPVVWVRSIRTLFFETACASGTAAVGIYLSQQMNQSLLSMPITQPSQKTIQVSTVYVKNKVTSVKFGSPVDFLGRYQISLDI